MKHPATTAIENAIEEVSKTDAKDVLAALSSAHYMMEQYLAATTPTKCPPGYVLVNGTCVLDIV